MDYQLTFKKNHRYDSTKKGISLEVTLKHGDSFFTCQARVDTGAEVCLFSREIAEQLNIDVESGERISLGTLTGGLIAYGHDVTLETLGLEFQTTIYFSEVEDLPRNLLGRQGWLHLVRIAIIDYESEIYLSAYQDEFH